jgi:hypothetical protein
MWLNENDTQTIVMRKIIFLAILFCVCSTIGVAQSENVSKSEKLNQSEIQSSGNSPIVLQYAEQTEKVYTESAFIKEYLVTNEVPIDLPERNKFLNSHKFRIALKQWIVDNPKLVKPNKRIKSK